MLTLNRATVPIEEVLRQIGEWFRQGEEALQETHRKLTAVLENMSDGFVTFDRQWRYNYVNPAAASIIGRRAEALLGRNVWEEFPDVAQAPIFQNFYRCLEQNVPVQFEYYSPRSGRWYENRCHLKPEGLAVYFNDITDRKAADEALKRSEARFRQLADAIPHLAWTALPDGAVDFCNKRVRQFEGIQERQDGTWEWKPVLHPDDAARSAVAWERALEAGEGYQMEHRLRMADGQWRWHLSRALPLRDEHGRLTKWVGTNTDIDDTKRTEAALAAAEATNRVKDRFLATLSHELRTPITPVTLAAQALAEREDLPDDAKKDVRMIRRGLELEARLVDDLLDVARIERGSLTLNQQVVEVHALLHQTIQQYCHLDCESKAIRLEVSAAALEHHVYGDQARLQQIFWNLLRNSIKFTPRNGRIEVKTANPAPTHLTVEVTDTGIGIAPDALRHVFNAFDKGGRREYGGLGLGLTIARALLEMHAGSIRVRSEGEGKGATFTVELPTVTAPGPASPMIVPDRTGTGSRRLRILLVEDDPDTVAILARCLRASGHEVRIAETVEAAKRAATEGDSDLLLCDLGLPDGSGLEVMRYLKERKPQAIGIALTGYGMREDIRRGREAGFAEHLTKPVDSQALKAAISRYS